MKLPVKTWHGDHLLHGGEINALMYQTYMPTLQYVQPTEEQKALMQNFRDKMEILYKEIDEALEGSRGKALALTKLEESAMWLNKGITHNS